MTALRAGLERLSDVIDVDQLGAEAKKAQVDGAVTFCLSSIEYLDLTFLWIKAARRCNIHNFLMVCADQASYDALTAQDIPAIRARLDTDPAHYSFDRHSGFRPVGIALMAIKYPVVAGLLDHGVDVLMCDIDAIPLRDWRAFFPAEVDFIFQRIAKFPPAFVELWGFAVCSGFMHFRNNERVRSLVQNCVAWNTRIHDDQLSVNLALGATDIAWTEPAGYSARIPLRQISKEEHFKQFASVSIRGHSSATGLSALALPADSFWRHPFVKPTDDLCISHPNSPKDQFEKLKILRPWLDRACG